jgi:hypothetical protein
MSNREFALNEVTNNLSSLSEDDLIPLWKTMLHTLEQNKRVDLLLGIEAFVPAIAVLGGNAAVLKTIQAIQDVSRWWS